MKTVLRSAVSAIALLSIATAASAADLPAYEEAPIVAVPSFSWTGFYIGANAGYIFGDRDITTRGRDAATRLNVTNRLRPPSLGIDGEGFTVGAQIGYNVQLDNSPLVFGVEADFNYADIDERARYSITPNPIVGGAPGTIRSSFEQEMEYFGTVRGRLGYAFGQFLVYGTGGLAYGKVKTRGTFLNGSATGAGPGDLNEAGAVGFSGRDSEWEIGYTVGGGVEFAVTENISVKGEYLYYDLGDSRLNVNNTGIGGAGGTATQVGYRSTFENDGHIVRAGINYKF